MNLEQALEVAAERLPVGAEITITVERDAGTVAACDWDGNWREFDSADMTIAQQVIDCVEWCVAQPMPARVHRVVLGTADGR